MNNQKDIRNMLKDTAVILGITIAAGLILAFVYEVTKEPIALAQEKKKMEACRTVFQDAFEFVPADVDSKGLAAITEAGLTGETVNEVMTAEGKDGELLGFVITVTTGEGYAGDIRFSMGIRTDGTLNGISILSISETAGLGMKAGEVLAPQFEDRKSDWFAFSKTGASEDNQIDAISGATITTNAVTNGVNAGLVYMRTVYGGGVSHE